MLVLCGERVFRNTGGSLQANRLQVGVRACVTPEAVKLGNKIFCDGAVVKVPPNNFRFLNRLADYSEIIGDYKIVFYLLSIIPYFSQLYYRAQPLV